MVRPKLVGLEPEKRSCTDHVLDAVHEGRRGQRRRRSFFGIMNAREDS